MRGIWAGALLTCYLAATLLVLLLGNPVRTDVALPHAILLVAVAIATWVPRVPAWVRHWTPLASLLFLYSELPALIAAAGHVATQDRLVLAWEQAVFGMQPARAWATAWPSAVLSELLHLGYLSYYGIIVVVAAALQWRRRDLDVARAVFVLLWAFLGCFAAYLVFPVAGPRYLWESAASVDGPVRRLTLWLLDARSSRGTAFPSSHVAVATTQCVIAWHYFGRRAALLALLTLLLASGAVYGGFHYAVDVVAGGGGGLVAGVLGVRWIARNQAKASAPT